MNNMDIFEKDFTVWDTSEDIHLTDTNGRIIYRRYKTKDKRLTSFRELLIWNKDYIRSIETNYKINTTLYYDEMDELQKETINAAIKYGWNELI